MKLQKLLSWTRAAVTGRERARRFMAAGDRARDRGEWAIAARRYERALTLDPNRAPIWVQYCHPLKEQVDISLASAVGWAFLPFDFHHSVLVNVYRGNRLVAATVANLHRPAALAVGPKYNWFQINWKDWRYEPSQTELPGLVFQRGEDGA